MAQFRVTSAMDMVSLIVRDGGKSQRLERKPLLKAIAKLPLASTEPGFQPRHLSELPPIFQGVFYPEFWFGPTSTANLTH